MNAETPCRGASISQVNCTTAMPYFKSSHDVMSGGGGGGEGGFELTPCNKIDKQLVVFRLSGNVMTSIPMLQT